jgi:signal transduction histidine kinase
MEEELGRRLCALAQVGAALVPGDLAAVLQPGDEQTRTAQNVRRKLETISVGSTVSRVLLVDQERRVRLDSAGLLPIGAEAPRLQFDRVEMAEAASGTPAASVLFAGPDGELYKSCYARAPGPIPLFVAVEGAADLFHTLHSLAGLYAVLLVAAMGLLVLLAFTVARGLAAPLARLSEDARSIGDGGLKRPIAVAGDDEIGRVARALDEMRLRLLARDEEQQMMLAGIAHEIRNPLGGMELFAGLLAEGVQDLPAETPAALRDELASSAARMRRELAYLSGVVNDFLAFARDAPPQQRDFQTHRFLTEVAELCRMEAHAHGVMVVVAPGVSSDAVVRMDDGQIRRALLNLTQNSVQASAAGQRVELAVELSDDSVTFRVRDDGPGMTAKQLQQALTPFFTTKEKGSGLGLPLVVKTARAHGGRLVMNTAPGQGCVALLILPRLAR